MVPAHRLRLHLFGHMAVDDTDGRTYLPRTRKTRALLAVLAIASPRPVLRTQLASILWSRREKEQARASLRQCVHELQDTLSGAWSHVLVADRHHLSLRGPELEIDALTLAQPEGGAVGLLDRYEAVLLEDLNGLDPAFDRWLEDERGRFIRIGRTIGESLLAQCDDPASAIEAAEQLLLIDRRHEGAWRAMMRAYAERGDIGAALGSYDRCRGVLAETGDGRPSPETEDLIAAIRGQIATGRMPDLAPPAPRTGRRERSTLRLRVMPLRSIGQERDDGLAAGLAEEIAAGLSRFRWISCLPATMWPGTIGQGMPGAGTIGPGTTGSVTGEVGGSPGGLPELNDFASFAADADLILDGTIQGGANRVRIIVRLVDMRDGGEIVWAGRFDRTVADALALQDELGSTIVAQVDPELMQHEARRNASSRSHDMTAQELLLQALPGMYRMERESFLQARRLLELSLRNDPTSSVAHGWLAYWDLLYVGQGWAEDAAATSHEAATLAERAVMLDPGDARALTLAGHVRGFLGKRPQEACALHDRAIALNPNLALAWCFSGLALSYLGRHDEALNRINQAVRLSPSDPHGFFFDMALIMPNLMLGEYARAVDSGRRAVELNPLFSSAYKGYLAALGLMGRSREAADVRARLLALEPGFSVREATIRSPLSRLEDIGRYAEGLRRAGLPEDRASIPADERSAAVPSENSLIDLVSPSPHSPI